MWTDKLKKVQELGKEYSFSCVNSGLIEQNEIWYEVESQRAYLFLGESNISWYVYEIATGRYMELDNPSGQEMTAFGSCTEMLEKLLDDCLN